jgi:hypothetical protein
MKEIARQKTELQKGEDLKVVHQTAKTEKGKSFRNT